MHLGLQQRYHGVHLNDVLPQSSAYPLCERRGGRPGLPVPNSPYGLCGRKATLNEQLVDRAQEQCENRGGRPGLPAPNSP